MFDTPKFSIICIRCGKVQPSHTRARKTCFECHLKSWKKNNGRSKKDEHKPYLLFAGSMFYPSGGWDDFQGYFSTVDDAKLWLQKNEPNANHNWAHIVQKDKIILWASANNNNWVKNDGTWEWREEE